MARLLAVLLLTALSPVAASAADPIATSSTGSLSSEQVVEARSRAWAKAAVDGDVDAFRSFATADYVMLWVDPPSKGEPARWHMRSRDEWIAMLRAGKLKYSSVVLRNTRAHVNGDIATFTGEYSQKTAGRGSGTEESGFFVETWVKRRGAWLAVSTVFP